MEPKTMQLPMRGVMPIITTASISYFIDTIFPIWRYPFCSLPNFATVNQSIISNDIFVRSSPETCRTRDITSLGANSHPRVFSSH
jgi:hypothetical protein